MSLTLRPATAEDVPFLREMLYEAARPEPGEPDPGMQARLAEPQVAGYIEGWPREGDAGVVAEIDGLPVGAAWCRLPGPIHGWGYVADDTPEVAIAVVEDLRGQGVGRALLDALIESARDAGFPALSLSAMPTDPAAIGLYEGSGFTRVGDNDDLWVMRLDLTRRRPSG